ncbi:helix-turn-helix transcriptional regulator [bacterium]|nr:helix-turn-helix transcriptional regulator [candidate division CSSED10-310 bacterium]
MNARSVKELKRLGQNIRRLRKAQKINQIDLAKRANTRSTTISLLENGLNPNPGWDLLDRIAVVLETTVHDLLRPDATSLSREDVLALPKGLVILLKEQDTYLSPREERVSLGEGEWLQKIPGENPDGLEPEDYLLLLRQLRRLRRL